MNNPYWWHNSIWLTFGLVTLITIGLIGLEILLLTKGKDLFDNLMDWLEKKELIKI